MRLIVTKFIRKVVLVIVLVYFSPIVTACKSPKEISVVPTANSNHNVPVSVDIVYIYDDKTASMLSEIDSPKWFQTKPELVLNFGNIIDIQSLEIVPPAPMMSLALTGKHKKATKILMFANYLDTKGQKAADLSGFNRLKIILLSDTYQLVELNK